MANCAGAQRVSREVCDPERAEARHGSSGVRRVDGAPTQALVVRVASSSTCMYIL